MRERILSSNIFLTFLPIILILFNTVLYMSMVGYFKTSDDSRRHSFKSWQFVYVYQLQLEVKDVLEDVDENGIDQSVSLFCNEKEKNGWNILIYRLDGELLYLTGGSSPNAMLKLVGATSDEKNTISSSEDMGTVLCCHYHGKNGGNVRIVLHNPTFVSFESGVAESATIGLVAGGTEYIWLAFIFSVAILVLCNAFVIFKVNKDIVSPLKKLGHAAKDLSVGNLDTVIEYDSGDEIGQLYSDVDSIRIKMKNYRDEQSRVNEIRRVMISGFVHDIGTPLTKLRGYSEGLIDGIADTEEKREKYIRVIHETATNMDFTLKQMSNMLKVDIAKVPLNLRTVDVEELMEAHFDHWKFVLEQNGINMKLIRKCRERAICNIDIGNSKRAIDNIVANTIKYKNPNRSDNEFVITLKTENGSLILEFADNGIGIAKGDEEKIFEMFYRGDKARTDIKEGSGIGLAIVKQIVEQHSGKIWARGSSISGLSIFVSIPLVQQDGDIYE